MADRFAVRPARTRKLEPLAPRIRQPLAATPGLTPAELREGGGRRSPSRPCGRPPGRSGTRSKKVVRAAERDRPGVRAARAAWQAEVAPALDPRRVVLVGEAAANTAAGRRYGCAPRGQPVVGAAPHGHHKSLPLPAAPRAAGRPPPGGSTGR